MLVMILIAFIVIFDQVSKHLIALYLENGVSQSVLPGFLSFYYHENRGAAWGMLEDHRWVFMSVSTLAILLILGYLIFTRKQKQSPLLLTSLAFFAGGGIGNMIDRVRLGYVIDFLRFDFFDFPIFNIADSFISVGAFLMFYYLILESIKERKQKKNISKTALDGEKRDA